jgi:hypothetical protein
MVSMKVLNVFAGLVACSVAGTACALSTRMPPFSTTVSAARAPAPPASVIAQLQALGSQPSRPAGRTERDGATDQTRVSLTTHHGAYFLWLQHPRVTFFYVFSGSSLEHAPSSVFLVFLSHEPQVPSTNHLALSCNGVEQAQGAIPAFAFETGPMVTNRVFTYELPLATFVDFARCGAPSVRVGNLGVPFSGQQLADLRAFAGGMRGGRDEP